MRLYQNKNMIDSDIKYYLRSFTTLIFLLLPLSLPAQNLRFVNFTTEDGLSNNKINAILQDSYGFLWVGTDDGLNRYDGYQFKIFRKIRRDSSSISDNSIWSLYEDGSGHIWAGTKEGNLNEYIPQKNVFKRWDLKLLGIDGNGITALQADGKNIWVGTYQNGLYKIDLKTRKTDHWYYNAGSDHSLSNNFVTSIVLDHSGLMWVSTYNGLNRANTKTGSLRFDKFFNKSGDLYSLPSNLIWSIAESGIYPDMLWVSTSRGLALYDYAKNLFNQVDIPAGKEYQFGNSVGSVLEEVNKGDTVIWAGTYSGLVRIDRKQNRTERFLMSKYEPRSLVSNQINHIIRDRSGVIWIATENGLSKISPASLRFNNTFKSELNRKLFSELYGRSVRTIRGDSKGKIYFGTENGIVLMNSRNSEEVNVIRETKGLNTWSLLADEVDNLWVGTYGQGLKLLDMRSHRIKNISIESPTFKTSAFNYIKSLLRDGDNILIGFWGGGLARLDSKSGNYKIWIKDENDPSSISYNDVWAIQKDRKGRIWVGTDGGGLNLFDNSAAGKFYKPIYREDGKTAAGSKSIYSICEPQNYPSGRMTKRDILWLGTNDGLCKLTLVSRGNNPDSITFELQSYTPGDGVTGKSVHNIIEDTSGNLWVSTGTGISFFDVRKEVFINYSNADGIIGEGFNSGAAETADGNTIYFGNLGGVNFFNPADLTISDYQPRVLISNFQIFNEDVGIDKNSVLTENIIMTKSLELSFAQNVFSFQLAALEFSYPQAIRFAYKMEGFDKDWIYAGTRRFITYTNLGSGNYTFKYKATNSDGVWNNKYSSISIHIGPPWWRTPWAYGIYFLLVISGIYALRRVEMSRMKLKNELEMKAYEAKRQRELEIMKSRFFANLSHEFRTPLTLIKGPLEELMNKRAGEHEQEYYRIIYRNSEKLQNLIDELLELTRLENAAIPLKARKQDVVKIAKGIFFSFGSAAKAKNIGLDFTSYGERILCWVDTDKTEKILNNLLSNALKFTNQNGSVSLEIKNVLRQDHEFAEVIIRDTGIGIASDKLQKIFDRFYQADDSSNRSFGGSGIGLALVKELADLHKWEIKVSSIYGEGTEFSLLIPLSDTYIKEEEKEHIAGKLNENVMEDSGSEDLPDEEIEKEIVETNQILSDKQTILIVEDSGDVRSYLKNILNNEYRIAEAVNGSEGLRCSEEILPDLIISDIMMPEMDGIEFCRKVKADIRISHIPVILLTARASAESRIEGLETGADDYLTKPFSSKELGVRVRNLLNQRKHLREIFSREIKVNISRLPGTTVDNEFLNRCIETANKNLSNADFNTEEFAKELFLSRSQFHRKLAALTGQGPGEFLRTIRLKRGAALLLERKLNIAQVAFEVGFNNPSHFSKAFRRMFNCLPAEFSKKSDLPSSAGV